MVTDEPVGTDAHGNCLRVRVHSSLPEDGDRGAHAGALVLATHPDERPGRRQYLRVSPASGTCPTVSLGAIEAASVSAMSGISLAALWAGLVVRRPATCLPGFQAAGPPTSASKSGRPAIVISLLVLAYLSSWTLNHIARLDWAFVGQRLVLLSEGVVAFSVAFGATRHVVEQAWSVRAALVTASDSAGSADRRSACRPSAGNVDRRQGPGTHGGLRSSCRRGSAVQVRIGWSCRACGVRRRLLPLPPVLYGCKQGVDYHPGY